MYTYKAFANLVGNDVVLKYGQAEITRILDESYAIILDYMKSNSTRAFDVTDFSTYELAQVDSATYEQAKYIIANGGNVGTMSGFDATGNNLIPMEEIEKRIVCLRAKEILKRTRYNYRGLW